jgi:release factor glutamine methyltransferase
VTFRELVTRARQRLEAAGIPAREAALDADLLARETLACDRASWLARQLDPVPAGFESSFESLVARRAVREPVAYIRGTQEFYGRDFRVSSAVLIPRPETELLIDEALLLLPALAYSRRLTVIDIGTGSGCVAITLALEFPDARYIATDVSAGALALARDNAERLGALDRIEFIGGAYYADRPGPFNLVVTNPPYVAERDRAGLQPEVVDHEPGIALFGGDDGLRDVREILRQGSAVLDDDGSILIEIGYGQQQQVASLVGEAAEGLAVVRTRADLQGIPRVAVIRRCA